MTRKYLTVRREKNRQLAEQDAARRCAYCRTALPRVTWSLQDFTTPGKRFCSYDCERDSAEADEMRREMEARR